MIHWSTLQMPTTLNGQKKEIPIPIAYVVNERRAQIQGKRPVLLLNGIGEGKRSVARTVMYVNSLGMQTYGIVLPFEKVGTDLVSIRAASVEAIACTVAHIKKTLNVDRVDVIARSQSGAAAILAAAEYDRLFENIALVAPFGITTSLLGKTVHERKKSIRKRLLKNTQKQSLRDRGTYISGFEITKNIMRDFIKKKLGDAFTTALAIDVAQDLKSLLANGHHIRIFASKEDVLFPYDEFVAVLGSEDELKSIKGIHGVAASRIALQHLQIATEWLNSLENKNIRQNK